MHIDLQEIQAKSILTPSKLPDCDYVINPYTGCTFSCVYCYASFMSHYVGKNIQDWGKFVFAKMNAPELLRKNLKKLKEKGKGKTIFMSSVTDPYQGIEAKYQLTRKCLEILAEEDFQGTVGILTKSDLVLRDIDVLKKLHDVEIGLTITSTDDSISRYFEKYAPPVSKRFEALRELNTEGISTYAFVGPVLPHYITEGEMLEKLFSDLKETGTKELYIEHINLSNYILGRLKSEVKEMEEDVINTFYGSQSKAYRQKLDIIIMELIEKYGFTLREGIALYHKEIDKFKK